MSRTQLPAWQQLAAHAHQLQGQHLRELFARDPARFERLSLSLPGLLLDYSKNRITVETLELLLALADQCQLAARRDDMWAGRVLNPTENRAVLHAALRDASGQAGREAGEPVAERVAAELAHMEAFVGAVRDGEWRGFAGDTITDVVAIGIGGSNLGPLMACEALRPQADGRLKLHFVSNVDGVQIAQTLQGLNPARTLFLVSSKTFTTAETMANANTARRWLEAAALGQPVVARHFAAVSAATERAVAWGIHKDNVFAMWDWVGGRYSLWSAIGLPIALYLGMEQFRQLLAGAHAMDRHFMEAEFARNAPVLLALIGVWNANFLHCPTQAILPYDQSLRYLPAYLQQADMESNGKSTTRAGQPVDYATGSIVWGQLGIDGQHAFYQLLHQGSHCVPVDFIASCQPAYDLPGHHETLLANCFAQSQALMLGVDEAAVRADLKARGMSDARIEALVAHKIHPGNRPSNTLLLDRLDAWHLGQLIALYEHKIFVQGVIWDVCSFDQWGVELGKQLASGLEDPLRGAALSPQLDSSTAGLISAFRAQRAGRG